MAVSILPPTTYETSTSPAPPRPALSDEQQDKLDTLIAHLNADSFTLPSTVKEVKAAQKIRAKASKDVTSNWTGKPLSSNTKGEQLLPLNDIEKCFLSNEQCQRFLRAVKWDLGNAFCRTEETIVWRREFEVEKINENPEMVEEESKTGKEIVMGWDNQRRPCLYMFPYRQNTNTLDRQIQFVVWCLERAVDLMGPEVENLCLLIDFGSGAGGSGQPTSLGQARKVLTILQTYYCERLGRALCIRIPGIFYTFYRFVGPFVDPVTKDKIRFNPDCRELVPPSQLDKEAFGGDYDFKYEHEEFWPFMHKFAQEKRQANFKRWQKYGDGKCGVSEFIIKGRNEAVQDSGKAETSSASLPLSSTAAGTDSTDQPIAATADNASDNASINTPAMTQSMTTSGQSSPMMPDTPANKAYQDERTSAQRNAAVGSEEGMNDSSNNNHLLSADNLEKSGINARERANSSDSFVTTQEATSPILRGDVRDDDKLEAKLAAGQQQEQQLAFTNDEKRQSSVDGIETGIAGLGVKDDGSIGAV